MSDLANESCEVCRVGAPLATEVEREAFLKSLPAWNIVEVDGIDQLERVFAFDDFVTAMDFSVSVGRLAEEFGHHPQIVLEWGRVAVYWWTHKISGLHKTDFVMAAKTDRLLEDC